MTSWSEFAAVFGSILGVGGFVVAWFKHEFETQSRREQRYRFCKEFFDDRGPSEQMHPVQLQRGYEGLGGPRGRSAEEIRYVLELSSGTPGVIDIHRRATLGQVKFDSVMQQFFWTGLHRYRPIRWVISAVSAFVYITGPYLGVFLVYTKYTQTSAPLTAEFVVQTVIAIVYFVALPLFGLIYVVRMSESSRLVRLSQGSSQSSAHPRKRLSSLARRVGAKLKVWISAARAAIPQQPRPPS